MISVFLSSHCRENFKKNLQDQRKSSPLIDIREQVWLKEGSDEQDEDDPLQIDLPPDSLVTPKSSPIEDPNFNYLEPVNLVFKRNQPGPSARREGGLALPHVRRKCDALFVSRWHTRLLLDPAPSPPSGWKHSPASSRYATRRGALRLYLETAAYSCLPVADVHPKHAAKEVCTQLSEAENQHRPRASRQEAPRHRGVG